MSSPDLAAVDLGSNTFRRLLAQTDQYGHNLVNRRVWQQIPRLSEDLAPGGLLAPGPKKRAWDAVETFNEIIRQNKPQKVLAGATMAFRLAADGEAFLAEIGQRFGWETHLLSGSSEARLSALGVLTGLKPIPPVGLIFDIGGRSTEFILIREGILGLTQSLDMGVVSLTSEYINNDPPASEELDRLERRVHSILQKLDPGFRDPEVQLVGTAGTVTTVAAILMKLADYDSELVNNKVFSLGDIEILLKRLVQMPLKTRQMIPGLHPRRADVISAGLIEVLGIMNFFQKKQLTVSDNSLLEGLWLANKGLVDI
jgi:exopolyphosphatase/guanosine-5'-triphosphate,3'-diphosphate pyrophosphatase